MCGGIRNVASPSEPTPPSPPRWFNGFRTSRHCSALEAGDLSQSLTQCEVASILVRKPVNHLREGRWGWGSSYSISFEVQFVLLQISGRPPSHNSELVGPPPLLGDGFIQIDQQIGNHRPGSVFDWIELRIFY